MTWVVPGHGQDLETLSKGLQSATALENHCCDKGSFPHSSSGKESACNAGDPGSIPGLGRSAGGGIGYPLQYPWASLVAQLVKNVPALQETWVRSLGWENPWRRERLPTPVFWPGEFHGQRNLAGYNPRNTERHGPCREDIWSEVLEHQLLLDQTPYRELVFEDLNVLVVAPGGRGSSFNWELGPLGGADRLAHGIPLVAELKNYMWRLSVWLGKGGRSSPQSESPLNIL